MPGNVVSRTQGGFAAALLPGQRCHRLLYQSGFPVGGRLDDPEVARLYAVLTEFDRGPQDGKCL